MTFSITTSDESTEVKKRSLAIANMMGVTARTFTLEVDTTVILNCTLLDGLELDYDEERAISKVVESLKLVHGYQVLSTSWMADRIVIVVSPDTPNFLIDVDYHEEIENEVKKQIAVAIAKYVVE